MDILNVLLLSLLSLAILFLLSKLMGNKQISQLTIFDYITGITIGSIAAEMSTNLEHDATVGITALLVYGVITFLISVISSRSLGFRKIFTGRPLTLMDKGKLYKENFRKARIDLSDFLTMCRLMGYFDLSQIETAIFEHNGMLSVLPKDSARPVSPSDMSMNPAQQHTLTSLVLDGHILSQNLNLIQRDVKWLTEKLKNQGYKSHKEVYLATCDDKYTLSVYPIIHSHRQADKFE